MTICENPLRSFGRLLEARPPLAALALVVVVAGCNRTPDVPWVFETPDDVSTDDTTADASTDDADGGSNTDTGPGEDSGTDPRDADSGTADLDAEPDAEVEPDADAAIDPAADPAPDAADLGEAGTDAPTDAGDGDVSTDAPDALDAADAADATADTADTADTEDAACAHVTVPCDSEGRECRGATLIVCEPDVSGCLGEIEVPCDVIDEVCAPLADGVPGCTPPCEPPALCDSEFSCDLEVAVRCEESPLGCLIAVEREDCARDGRLCRVAETDALCMDACGEEPACDPGGFVAACIDEDVLLACRPSEADGCFGEQLVDCAEAGRACDDTAGSAVCAVVPCGDGTVDGEAGEGCDDANRVNGDGCSGSCAVESGFRCYGEPSVCVPSVCGNGSVEFGEGCDDENLIDGDGCSSECHVELPPRDESLRRIHMRPDGGTWRRPNSACRAADGALYPMVARWVVNPYDEPLDLTVESISFGDDGAWLFLMSEEWGPGAEASTCLAESHTTFGGITISRIDRLVAPGEVLVVAVSTARPDDTLSSSVIVDLRAGFCGNGRWDAGTVEECEDGNEASGDGCTTECVIEDGWVCTHETLVSECRAVVCGDGVVDPEEDCDDGNTDSGDGCDSECRSE